MFKRNTKVWFNGTAHIVSRDVLLAMLACRMAVYIPAYKYDSKPRFVFTPPTNDKWQLWHFVDAFNGID